MAPIKNEYDGALSCGDLILMVLSGYDAAILSGGGPLNRVCAGRIDQINVRDDSDVLNILKVIDLAHLQWDERFLGVPDQERTEIKVREIYLLEWIRMI